MDEKQVFAQKQKETSKQFWDEVEVVREENGLNPWEAKMCCYYICGMPSWKAFEQIVIDYAEEFQSLTIPEHISGVRKLSQAWLARPAWKRFMDWAKVRSQELYALNLHEYDWKFKDSEIELRYILDAAKQQLERSKMISQDIIQCIISATKELNAMYKYNGNNFDAQKAKMVIFVGEDELED